MRRGAAAAALALGLGVTGCGGSDTGGSGPLVWNRAPRVLKAETRDRVLLGRIRNTSLRRVKVASRDVRLYDADGDRVPATVIFLDSFTKPLTPFSRESGQRAEVEAIRIGQLARVEPGRTAPLTVSWRQPRGAARPARIDYGSGSLPVPR